MVATDVFNALVAAGTLALAAATVCPILDARQARKDERFELQRGAFRAALVEQLENCRLWSAARTNLSGPIGRLRGWQPKFGDLSRLLGTVDLPGELATYLIWAAAVAREENERVQPEIAAEMQGQDSWPHPPPSTTLPGQIAVTLERLQVIACLLACEARRRGFSDVFEAFRADATWLPWLKPEVWPKEKNRSMTAFNDPVFRFGPPWPRDAAYQDCSPEARDRHAQELLEQQKAVLHQAAHANFR